MKNPQSKLSPEAEQSIEQAKRETRELNKNLVAQLRTALEKNFARTDAKVEDKEEEIIRKLDIIISQKQN